jgi:hypothetical protein
VLKVAKALPIGVPTISVLQKASKLTQAGCKPEKLSPVELASLGTKGITWFWGVGATQ